MRQRVAAKGKVTRQDKVLKDLSDKPNTYELELRDSIETGA